MKSLLALGSAVFLGVTGSAAAQTAGADEEEIVVTAARTALPRSALPNTIQIIDEATVDQQAQLTGSAADVVASMVPSFAPTREKLSGAGETLRGRSPLYLIDGVPQSNPLRDGSRDGYTIDPFFIDRVEVIFGSNAIQGIGATGGVVNYVTPDLPDETEGWEGRVLTQMSTANEFQGDGFGYRTGAIAGRDFGAFDLMLGAAGQSRGAFYDGDGRRVGIDGAQGETQDSLSWSLFLKAGADLSPHRRIELMAQHFELEGDGDYVLVPGSRAAGVPASAARGTTPGEFPTNEITTVSLTYEDSALFGGLFNGQLYYQDFSSVFGGGVFPTFQDPAIDPTLTLFDQSANNSTKLGFRLSYERQVQALPGFRVIAGLDGIQDETFQELILTGRNWVPETTFQSIAPFVQLHQSLLNDRLHLSGGVRRENANFEVDDYETLYFYGPQTVGGGSPEFEETLTNFGATFEVADGLTAYSSFAQGFTMADIGRILRAVNVPGQDVDTFIDVQPVVSDNTEVGLEWRRGPLSASAAYFWSTSDQGALLVLVGGVYEVERQRTEIDGLELGATWTTPIEGLTLSGGYAMLEGRADTNGDGRVDADLDGANISPDRINAAVDYERGLWGLRLQTRSFLDRQFDDPGSATDFDGYTLIDAFARYRAPFGDISLAVANLLDEQYVTYNSQTVQPTSDTRFFAGRGRVITIGLERRF
ncbi:MAG: TonB-dependent receptor [Hyphomonadaceae bacterium]